eukprot:4807412-Lingulodinium_polyedra.AAC.1
MSGRTAQNPCSGASSVRAPCTSMPTQPTHRATASRRPGRSTSAWSTVTHTICAQTKRSTLRRSPP